MNEAVSSDYLRALADLIDEGTVSVIKCELRPQGILLGVVAPTTKYPATPAMRTKVIDIG